MLIKKSSMAKKDLMKIIKDTFKRKDKKMASPLKTFME